jgi:hypothetical protein
MSICAKSRKGAFIVDKSERILRFDPGELKIVQSVIVLLLGVQLLDIGP